MSERELALSLLQQTYYDGVDAGDMARATSALHEDIEWSHAQVWAHHEFAAGKPTRMQGRAAIREFLEARREQLAAAGIRHAVVDLVIDGGRGAFLGQVTGPDGTRKPFMVWFELRDGLIGRYLLRPL
jgi:ketosteroid isomerase-like protein